MSHRTKKSKSDPTDDYELPASAYDAALSSRSNPSTQSSAPEPEKSKATPQNQKPEAPLKSRLSKEEREKLKRMVTIGTEDGVGPSNRKMSRKEKKCLSKGKKKMEKLVKREEELKTGREKKKKCDREGEETLKREHGDE